MLFADLTSHDSGPSSGMAAWESAWKALLYSFAAAGTYSLAAGQIPAIKTFPIATWVGLPAVTAWGWDLTPSMGYVGQGMIMGPRTAFSMLGGAVAGELILSHLSAMVVMNRKSRRQVS